jgi:hypothetical protein
VIVALLLLACSGPGAQSVIAESIAIGYYNAGFAVLVTAALFFLHWSRHGRAWPARTGSLLVMFHPAWTISAIAGDCGYFKRDASCFVSVVCIALLAFQLYVSRSRHRNV